uniref:Neuromedin U C-terminal domain-containing protein n=1 Tax=Xiphophorus couchianus TaxID=32473 RepID=A0A3B5LH67_9TELE
MMQTLWLKCELGVFMLFCEIKGAPVSLQQVTTDQRQLLRQIDAVCSSYLSADLKYWTSDVIGELCMLMLVQKSKVSYIICWLSVVSKCLVVLLHIFTSNLIYTFLGGPGGIESRGYFLYRPRNGKRSLEYE